MGGTNRARHGLLSILIAGTLLLGLVPAGSASADATFTVTSRLDLADTTPGDGVCRATGDVCTLRAAIMESSASGANVIFRSAKIVWTIGIMSERSAPSAP